STSKQKETQTSTSVLPTSTTIQQQNTDTTGTTGSLFKPHINFNETIPSRFEWMNKPARCNAALLIINCINNENNWQKNGRFQPPSSTSLKISWNSLEGDKCSGIEWDSYSVNYKIRGSDGSSDRKSSNFPVVLPIQHH
ncbi:hypothetical protein cypCar_00048228, partial [Cyprinus carpio]